MVSLALSHVRDEIGVPGSRIVVVHGGQGTRDREGRVVKGLDLIVDEQARRLGMVPEPHPADWDLCAPGCRPSHRRPKKRGTGTYCPTAGHRRNAEMVDLGVEYWCCLAFPLVPSPGTRDCMKRARLAGIRVINCTEGPWPWQ